MGSSESTGGGSEEAGTDVAIAAAVAAVAWGIFRMLSGSTDTRSQEEDGDVTVKAPGNSGTSSHLEYEIISWSPPPPGRFKMNTDGGSRPNPGPSGYGGILRDDHGEWVRGFRGFIGESDCLTAEFHGILKGLQLLDKLGLCGSILESDSTAAIKWIKRKDKSCPGNSLVIRDCWETITECRRLINKNKITLNRISRDANKCADKLVDMAIDKQEEYVDIKNLPDEIKHIVNVDLGSLYLGYPS